MSNGKLNPATTAILLIAHGSRRQEANDELVKLAELLREEGTYSKIEIAFLELADPNIPAGVEACVKSGVEEVRMLPFFLSPGRHVVEDLERFRQEFSVQYSDIHFTICPPLGLHPKIIEIILDRIVENCI